MSSIFSNRFSDARREAGEYTRAVLNLLGDRDPLGVLDSLEEELDRVLAGLSEAQLQRPESPGKWSMLAVVRHLLDSDWVWGYRLRKIVAEDRPEISGYDQDRWAGRLRYDDESLDEVRDDLRALRRANLRFLRALTPEERERVGVHSERGEESVEHLVRMYAGHDILHVRQLDRIRAAITR